MHPFLIPLTSYHNPTTASAGRRNRLFMVLRVNMFSDKSTTTVLSNILMRIADSILINCIKNNKLDKKNEKI
uniref:Uncharacterized protein n=1 Tax=Heterorhabditis bacteriophora TaxID=37862 RepID=A0A1I7WHV5_HETBA